MRKQMTTATPLLQTKTRFEPVAGLDMMGILYTCVLQDDATTALIATQDKTRLNTRAAVAWMHFGGSARFRIMLFSRKRGHGHDQDGTRPIGLMLLALFRAPNREAALPLDRGCGFACLVADHGTWRGQSGGYLGGN